jgi:hypothetical protein
MTRHCLSGVAFALASDSDGKAFCKSFQAKEIWSNHWSLKYGSNLAEDLSLMSLLFQMLYRKSNFKIPMTGGDYGSKG